MTEDPRVTRRKAAEDLIRATDAARLASRAGRATGTDAAHVRDAQAAYDAATQKCRAGHGV